MRFKTALKYVIPAMIVVTPAVPALAKNPAAIGGHYLAGALVTEIASPIIAEQIMKVFGLSSGADSIDYGKIRDIVEEVIADENKKQTMGRLLSALGGVDKTVNDIAGYVVADKNVTIEPSSNDEKIKEGIAGLWTPLNTVLAEFEGQYTGESHELIEAYMMASHLKMSLAALQLSRAHKEQLSFAKMLKEEKKKTKQKELTALIKDRQQVQVGHASVYASQAVAASNFLHALTYNNRKAIADDYIDENVSKCKDSATFYYFNDTAKYDQYDPNGGAKNPFGAIRYNLRNATIKKAFPVAKGNSQIEKAVILSQLEDEETYKFFGKTPSKAKSSCNKVRDGYTKLQLPTSVFFQTQLRYDVLEVYGLVDAQVAAAKKLNAKYRFRMPKLARNPADQNIKMTRLLCPKGRPAAVQVIGEIRCQR